MKCKKCQKKNVTQAKYCYSCGYEFTQEEKKEALKKDFAPRLYHRKEFYDKWSLNTLQDKWYMRILLLLLSVGGGILLFTSNGNHIRILKSKQYDIKLLKTTKEYYLYTPYDETSLNIYFPHNPDIIYVDCYKDKKKISSNKYKNSNELLISTVDNYEYCKIYIDKKNQVILHPIKEEK